MNEIIKSHPLYGKICFKQDYDGLYKPVAKGVLKATGNNTAVNYNNDSLLEKRELYALIESSKNNLEIFSDWIYNNYNKLNNVQNNLLFKDETEILSTITADDFARIDIHPFSCNKMYEAHKSKIERTEAYNAWWNNFPTDELIKFKNVDFNKPVFVWYYFNYLPTYDIENLLKPTSDKLCAYLATTDKNFNYFKISGRHVDKYNEGSIMIFICNVEEIDHGPF